MNHTQPFPVRSTGRSVTDGFFAALALLALMPEQARAGAFALTAHNAVGLGAGYSSAAMAADASTTYFNPAGLTRIKAPEIVVVANVVRFNANFANDRSHIIVGRFPISGGNGGNAGRTELIPNLYYAHPLNDNFVFGIGLFAPWGLETDYEDGWVGRYHALKTRIESANLNPSFGWRMTENLSFGAGFNVQRVKAEMSNAIDFGFTGGFAPGNADGKVSISGDSIFPLRLRHAQVARRRFLQPGDAGLQFAAGLA